MKKLRRVGVVSVAKFFGVIGFFVGLLIAVRYLLIVSVLSKASGGLPGGVMLGGIGGLLMTPVFCALTHFIIGLIYGALGNVVLRVTGGIDVDLR